MQIRKIDNTNFSALIKVTPKYSEEFFAQTDKMIRKNSQSVRELTATITSSGVSSSASRMWLYNFFKIQPSKTAKIPS